MSKDKPIQPPKQAGRPRSEKARKAALEAAFAILSEKGFGRITVEAVAARAGVGKPTLYRYWANAQELAMAALMEHGDAPKPANAPLAPTSQVARLRHQLISVAARFATPTGRQVAMMIASSDQSSELSKSFRSQVIGRSRSDARGIMELAISGGELRRDLNIEIALDMLLGPIFYRLLSGHLPIDEKFCEALLRTCLTGLKNTHPQQTPA